MKVGELLGKLVAKAGINLADDSNKNLADAIAAITTTIPDEQAASISSALMTKDEAMSNYDIKIGFLAPERANIYGSLDAKIENMMKHLSIDQGIMDLVRAEKSTFAKLDILAPKLKEFVDSKVNETGKGSADLKAEINRLTSIVSDKDKKHAEEIQNIRTESERALTQTQIRSILNGKSYSNKDLPKDVNVETAIVLMNRELEKSGAKIVNDNGTLRLKKAIDNDLDWTSPSGEKTSFEQFLDGTLAANKLLAVTTAPPPPGGGGNQNPPPIPGGQNGNANPSVLSSMQEDLKAAELAFTN